MVKTYIEEELDSIENKNNISQTNCKPDDCEIKKK